MDVIHFLTTSNYSVSAINAALLFVVFKIAKTRWETITTTLTILQQQVREHDMTFRVAGITIQREEL